MEKIAHPMQSPRQLFLHTVKKSEGSIDHRLRETARRRWRSRDRYRLVNIFRRLHDINWSLCVIFRATETGIVCVLSYLTAGQAIATRNHRHALQPSRARNMRHGEQKKMHPRSLCFRRIVQRTKSARQHTVCKD